MYHVDEELDSVLAFQALVGQRRHGHFDHDAHGVTGTSSARVKRPSLAASGESTPGVVAFIKFKRDEKTGAPIRE